MFGVTHIYLLSVIIITTWLDRLVLLCPNSDQVREAEMSWLVSSDFLPSFTPSAHPKCLYEATPLPPSLPSKPLLWRFWHHFLVPRLLVQLINSLNSSSLWPCLSLPFLCCLPCVYFLDFDSLVSYHNHLFQGFTQPGWPSGRPGFLASAWHVSDPTPGHHKQRKECLDL